MSILNIFIGCESFRSLRENHCCYIDKTSFLEEFLATMPPTVSLVTRPRRFGKTLTMSMLQEFFDIRQQNSLLFEGLAISRNKKICLEWMNQYPVIFLTFKSIEGVDFNESYLLFRKNIINIIRDHDYILKSEAVPQVDKDVFYRIIERNEDASDCLESLNTLCHALEKHWGKPVILLIDEYDVPINYAEQKGYHQEMVDFMRKVLGSALKTNPALKFAVLTGCLRIAKESIFTGLNNFMCYALSDQDYADKFGFTEAEVDDLLKRAELTEHKAEIKEWYDGYRFGENTEVYCPWDILSHIFRLQKNPKAIPKLYWINTSGNTLVRTLVSYASQDIRRKVESLLAGEAIQVRICEELTYDSVYENENNLWTILYLTGYLTCAAIQPDNNDTALQIPNKEVRQIFTETISQWFYESIAKRDLRLFIEALWKGESAIVQATLTDILYSTISYFDQAENYYHGFLTGLFRGAGFAVISNREVGLGRPDIVLEDARNGRAIIFEVKLAKNCEDLDTQAEAGLRQIEERHYVLGLEPQIRKVVQYGLAFWKKESCVKASEYVR
ncbi:MAG: ATP-binding protein [Desulfovibrio sp.]|nr:ATP-binding protein [Desulfovibrio sp.]